MYETFENLPESKREHILQVCIEEFARNGYKGTSTNTIVKRLGISKGVLFLYFKSKANLYMYIINKLTRFLADEFFEHVAGRGAEGGLDIFDHLGEFYNILLKEKPHILKLMLDAFLNAPEGLNEEIQREHDRVHEEAMSRMNIGDLRQGIDPQRVIDILHMISYYVGQLIYREYCGELGNFKKNVDKYVEEFREYVDIIKYGVYK